MAESPLFTGIEIGGTKLQLATGTADGKIVDKKRFHINPGKGAGGIRQQLAEGWDQLHKHHKIAAVGVGFGGPVDEKTGIISTSHQVYGWTGFNLVQWLGDLTGKPVAIDNDANTAALAEAVFGHGKGYELVFYITIGSGIGGGFVINGKIYHGKTPGEAEIGHVRLYKEGLTLEECCSGWAVDQRVKEAIAQNPGSLLAQTETKQEAPAAALLVPALEKRDETARQLILEVADDLAFALSHVVHLFHPDVIIIGGGLSLLKDHLLAPVNQQLARYVMKAFSPPPPVRLAMLEEDVVPVGALELARRLIQNKHH